MIRVGEVIMALYGTVAKPLCSQAAVEPWRGFAVAPGECDGRVDRSCVG